MILEKKDKNIIIELQSENSLLKNENEKLKNETYKNIYKSEIMNLLKAIILKISNHEIKIEDKELLEAEQYDLYVQDEYMSFAKRYQVIDRNKRIKL